MSDCFSKSEVTDFLNFMKLPDGTSVVSDDLMEYLMAYGFFTAPASTKYHGNYEGGLLNHSRMVTEYLLALTQANHLTWKNPRSPYIVGMFHDLCKIDQYRHPVTGHIEEFNGGCTPIYDEQAWPYNPAAHDDLLDHTLNRLACDDPEVRALLEEMVGYCMYRRNELGKAFILIGDKSNGKSTFLHVVKNLLGDQNIASLDLKELGDRFKTAELFGKLANIGDDIGDEFIANASVFKKLVTGDRVNVERKGQDPFEFNNYSKFLFSANNIPRIKDKTGAVQRRLVIVPFDAKFTPNDADFRPFIKDELCEQGSMEYLALLGLQGLKRVLGNAQFTTSSRVQGQLDEYEENNNPIIGFINEVGVDGLENEATDSVYRRYKEYCIANNFQALSKIEFSRQITKRCGFTTALKWIRNRKTRVFVKGGDTE